MSSTITMALIFHIMPSFALVKDLHLIFLFIELHVMKMDVNVGIE